MVKASELKVHGTQSQYQGTRPVVNCLKTTQNGGAYLPCRYNKKTKTYDLVEFPKIPDNVVLRPEQAKVLQEVDALVERQGTVACHPIFAHIHTGFGKSLTFAIYAISKGYPILVIANSDTVRKGWIGTFNMLGIDPYIASGNTLGKHNVCILSIQLAVLHKFGRDAYAHYGTVIVDEADTCCTQLSVNELLDMAPKYFIGMTATVRRNDGLDKVLDVFWGHRRDWIKRLKEFGEDCTMHLYILYTGYTIQSRYNARKNLDWGAMAQEVANIYERNLLIRNLCLLHSKEKILILCKRVEHVEILSEMLRDIGEDVSTYHGKASTYYDAHILVATLSKAGRGYDDKQVASAFDGRRFGVLILTMTMKDADQALGRGLRGNKIIVYLPVDDNPTMKKHADTMKSINAKRGAFIHEEHM